MIDQVGAGEGGRGEGGAAQLTGTAAVKVVGVMTRARSSRPRQQRTPAPLVVGRRWVVTGDETRDPTADHDSVWVGGDES